MCSYTALRCTIYFPCQPRRGCNPGVMNEPGNRRWSPVYLRGPRKSFRRLEPCREVSAAQGSQSEAAVVLRLLQTRWKELSTESKGGIATYLIRSFRRFCSSTSPGSAAKRASSATIRESRFSISSPMATASCRWIRQRSIQSMGITSELRDLHKWRGKSPGRL